MSDETALLKPPATAEVANKPETAEVANKPEQLPLIQHQLAAWAAEKLAEVEAEYRELDDACSEAKENKWNTRALSGAKDKALERMEFYQKVKAALAEGYMLFPPIDNIEVLAVRTSEKDHAECERLTPTYHFTGPNVSINPDTEPLGEGEYKNPRVYWTYVGKQNSGEPGKEVERKRWQAIEGLRNPSFPLVMAKPACVEATNAAMERKVFDEIALYPARARRDPVILGRIRDPARKRSVNFLISWRVDKRDL